MRVAVIDVGSNTARLLVASVNADGSVDSTFNPAELNGNIYVLLPLAVKAL